MLKSHFAMFFLTKNVKLKTQIFSKLLKIPLMLMYQMRAKTLNYITKLFSMLGHVPHQRYLDLLLTLFSPIFSMLTLKWPWNRVKVIRGQILQFFVKVPTLLFMNINIDILYSEGCINHFILKNAWFWCF